MNKIVIGLIVGVVILVGLGWGVAQIFLAQQTKPALIPEEWVVLPAPVMDSETSIEEALLTRRSIRDYQEGGLALSDVSQLLWAAQGITDPSGKRTAPSAGALYPLEVYLVVGEVEGLTAGVYRYLPAEHALTLTLEGDIREALAEASLGQEWVLNAPASILITAVFERTTRRYGQRGERYVYMEVGSVAQNVYLQAVPLGIGTVFVGAFHEDQVIQAAGIVEGEVPVCILPVGRK